jgi:transcription termination factor Rho
MVATKANHSPSASQPAPAPMASAPAPIAPASQSFPQSPRSQAETQTSAAPTQHPTDHDGPREASGRREERRERPPHDGQNRNFQQREPQQRDGQGPPRETRSKRRRDKRKRRAGEHNEPGATPHPQQQQQHPRQRHEPPAQPRQGQQGHDFDDRRTLQLNGPKIETNGMLELAPKGFGFLRLPGKNFEQARDDVFVTPEIIRKYNLRLGQWIHGLCQDGPRGPQLVEITQVNDMPPEDASKLPHFDELKAINPAKRISFETTPERFTTRVVDIMAPVGRGQRGLIVSPPRSGKTTLLLHMAEAIREKYEETIHLMVVLVDERPEEVTEFRRALPGAEIYASSNDEQPRNHCRIAELAIERAKRLVEAGKDVFLLMDSITRLARAYNSNMNNRGRGTGSGGITIGALEIPRRLFAAARNTRGGGSLTILATALIQTNSRADEAIFMEFKGTGNMELVLDRKIAENYIYPAVDIFKSGTRREELLLPEHMLHKIHLIRRGLSGHRPAEAMERLLFFLKKFPNNPQMLLEIKG